MAPYPVDEASIHLSSSEIIGSRSTPLDLIGSTLETLVKRTDLAPSEVFKSLTARDGPPTHAPDHSGAVEPGSINMKGIQALFAIIGAAFVLASIWFFFWAKNGGFHFQKGDWEDYKSTVLRRKGPNGTTLSNATKSTKLGGGSVVKEGYSDGDGSTWDGTHTDTMTETMTDLSSEAPIIKESKPRKETAKERKIRLAKEASWEGGHDNDVRAYRHEKPARVGGINKDSEALHYGTDYTDTDGSVLHSHTHRQHRQPTETRQPSRRDFSFGNEETFSAVSSSQTEEPAPVYPSQPPAVPPHRPGRYHSPSKQHNTADPRQSNVQGARPQHVPGGFNDQDQSDLQSHHTKSYHHPIPGLSAGQTRGFRRDRRDSLDD